MKEIKIDLNDKELKQRLASQLTKYFGSREKVKIFANECKAVGLELGNPDNIRNIAMKPEWFSVLISYSELGLLSRLGEAVEEIKQIKIEGK